MPHPAFTDDDKAFLRAILSNPAELTAWLVYADWLDERDDPRAEFIRLEVRRGQLRETDPERDNVEVRLRRLRKTLDPKWVAVFDRPEIERCGLAFAFECPRRWENLRATEDTAVRHCDSCRKDVYYCRTVAEARDHARQGHCVAVQLGVRRHPNDLEDPVDVLGLPMYLESGPLPELEEPDEPEPPRRPWWRFW